MDQSYSLFGMPGVGFLGLIVIGLIAGWVAERAMNRDHGLFTNFLVGHRRLLRRPHARRPARLRGTKGFLGNLLVATVGAVIVLWIFGRFRSVSVW